MRLDILRLLSVLFQLFPKRRHENTEGSDIVLPAASPDFLCDKRMRQHLPCILRQQAEQLVLDGVR